MSVHRDDLREMRGRRTDHAKVLERLVIVPLETPDEFALIRTQKVEPLRAVSDTRNGFELGLTSKTERWSAGVADCCWSMDASGRDEL